ncbi:MAG: SH3 domain-containing protein [Oscillospiraceae bacterium]|nr:SH3 domain-containing protein [Oscillospiraceae bacterium]
MKRRLLSLLLTAALMLGVVSALSVPAFAASTMKASENCIALIKQYEGFVLKPAWDFTQWSVGYGSRCEETEYPNGITEEQADALLRVYVALDETALNQMIDANGLSLNQYQFDALVDFCYNCGYAWTQTSGTFKSAILNGATGNVFLNAIAAWCSAGNTVYSSLVRRRLAEANLYFNGVYSVSPPSQYCYVLFNGNGGGFNPKVYAFDASTAPIANPATANRSGYTLLGWYTASTVSGQKVTELTSSLSGRTLFAIWQKDGSDSPEYPAETAVNYTGKVTASSLNVRSDATTSSSVLKMLSTDTPVTIVAEIQVEGINWGKLSEGGWVSLQWIEKDPAEATTPEETTPEETTPEDPGTTTTEVTVTGSIVNVRSGAGTGNAVTGTVKMGDKVTIGEVQEVSGASWGELSTGGWICLQYTDYSSGGTTTTPTSGTTVTVTGSSVNIRSGAGTSNSITQTVTKGTQLEVGTTTQANGQLWGELSTGGWICLQYTDYSSGGTTTPTTPTTPVSGTAVTVTSSAVNVRSGAGTGNGIVSTVYKGESVTVLSTAEAGGSLWGQISSGWISLQYTDYSAGGGTTGGTTTGGEASGTISASGGLRVRSSASLSGSVVATLANGTAVQITEQVTADGMTWGHISSGWISMNYVVSGSGGSTSSGSTYTVTGSVVNVRSGAGTGNGIISTVKRGTSVTIVATASANGMTWGQMQSGGWISMNYVS